MEVAVVGRLTIDGLDRSEFHRLVRASGSKVSVQVNDDGEYVDGDGNVITEEEALTKINSNTRLIVIGDLGNTETKDQELVTLFEAIQKKANKLLREAEKRGIYDVGLSTYLEHIGYTRKQASWTPENSTGFPGKLVNGAKSAAVNASYGNRQSSAVISGRFSGRRRQTAVSAGTTSKYYQQ